MRRIAIRVFVTLLLTAQTFGLMAARRVHYAIEASALGHTEHLQAPGDDPCIPSPDEHCPTCRLINSFAVLTDPHSTYTLHTGTHSDGALQSAECLPGHDFLLPLGSRPPPQL